MRRRRKEYTGTPAAGIGRIEDKFPADAPEKFTPKARVPLDINAMAAAKQEFAFIRA